jgi:hypothetical protein
MERVVSEPGEDDERYDGGQKKTEKDEGAVVK